MVALKRFIGGLRSPFQNLTPQQRILQFIRFGASLVTLCFAIAFLATRSMTGNVHVARISSARLDVAMGLYKSLRTSISSTSATFQMTGDILPADLTLTDSEIAILTAYTERQVSDAAQYILLGSTEFCMVIYDTSYNPAERVLHRNVTEKCLPYGSGGVFDYRTVLLDAGLTIILAYAYESNFDDDDRYIHQSIERNKQFLLLPKVMIFQIIVQIVILLYGFVLYSNRGAAKDLSGIPSITLNILAVMTVGASVTLLVVTGLLTREIDQVKREISKGMSNFGIRMKTGKLFLFIIWATSTFAMITMLSWAIPVWCSNPPEDGYASDEDITYQYETSENENIKKPFVARPYHAVRNLRRNRVKPSISKLFDDTADFPGDLQSDGRGNLSRKGRYRDKNPFVTSSEIQDGSEDSYDEPQMVELSSKYQTESELRKLGETMARKISVRRLGTVSKPRPPRRDWLPEKEATQNLLYGDNGINDHKYPMGLFSSSDTTDLSRKSTVKEPLMNRTEGQSNGNHLAPFTQDDHNQAYDDISLLEDQEMEYLDNNHFINKIV